MSTKPRRGCLRDLIRYDQPRPPAAETRAGWSAVTVSGKVVRLNFDVGDKVNSGQVTISEDVLNKVGVNKTALGNSGVLLTIDPNIDSIKL